MKTITGTLRAAVCLVLGTCALPSAANDFTISVGFDSNYYWNVSIDGAPATKNPPLILIRGQTYTFHVTGLLGFHSFYIKTASSTGAGNSYNGGGLSANGFSMDTSPGNPVTFTVPQNAPDALFYNCGLHISMAGAITVDGVFHDGFDNP